MKHVIIFLINLYQKTLSPDHGPLKVRYPHGFCRFHPSCSEYTKQAIEKYGTLKGISLGAYRIVRCNPFTQPKIDNIN